MPLYNPNQGGVSSVSASPPLMSSGGSTPEIGFDSSTPNGIYSLNVSGGTFTLVETVGETVGSVKAFATTSIPSNYLWCNGSNVLIATYPDLFDVIGTTYGGDGITNFNLPNLTDRFIKGDNGSNIGSTGGSNTLTENQLPIVSPTGTIEVSSNPGDIFAQTDAWISGSGSTDGGENVLLFVEDGLQGGTISVSGFNANSFGNNEEHEHPSLTLRYAICFESVGVSTASPTPSFSQTLAVNNDSNIRAQFNGVNYITETEAEALISVFVEQTHISGPSVIIDDTTTILYVDPASAITSLTITLPAVPVNGQEVKISFGGTITLGVVCTTLAVVGNTGHSVLGGVTITTADAGDGYIFKFQSSTNLWRIF